MALIRIDVDTRGVATLTLTRADKHNALSAEMIAELDAAAKTLGSDPAVRVVVLAAEGATFCAGGDLGWMQAQIKASPEQRHAGAMKLARMLQAVNTLSKPLIGRVHGNAFGGGVGLMAVCDTCIGVSGAQFALTETRLGLIPATIGPYIVARMGAAKARRVFMNSARFDADAAVKLGLLAEVVAPEQLDAAVEAAVTPYLACAPRAVAAAKALTLSLGPVIDEEVLRASADALVSVWEGDEAQEGIAAFFEKRKPSWAS